MYLWAAGYNPTFPFWDVSGAAAWTVSKASQGTAGWRGSDSVLAWGSQPFQHTLGKSCCFPPRSVVLQRAVCSVLICLAVSVEVVGDFRKEGSGHPTC